MTNAQHQNFIFLFTILVLFAQVQPVAADLGDVIAGLLGSAMAIIAICAGIGWYKRRGGTEELDHDPDTMQTRQGRTEQKTLDIQQTQTRLGSSQRSIFGSYWSSPTHTKSLETNGDDDELMLMVKLKMLKSPSISNTDDASRGKSSDAAAPKIVEATITKPFAEPNKSFTDDSFDYQSALVSEPPRRTPRRQILPTPPPPTAMSSSLLQPRLQQHLLLSPLGMERKGFSTSVLLKRPQPSCLRKSRYPSCDATMGRLHHGLRNNGYSELNRHQTMPYAAASGGDIEPTDLKKSVSFYAQVKVLEFSVPRERRSDIGWSKQFA